MWYDITEIAHAFFMFGVLGGVAIALTAAILAIAGLKWRWVYYTLLAVWCIGAPTGCVMHYQGAKVAQPAWETFEKEAWGYNPDLWYIIDDRDRLLLNAGFRCYGSWKYYSRTDSKNGICTYIYVGKK